MTNAPRLVDDVSTHQGCVRTANEDSLARLDGAHVWAVADGMGGHRNGQYASRKIADALAAAKIPSDLDGASAAVAEAIATANAELYAESQANGEQMGSTVVSLLIRDQQFVVQWVGDSRAYLFRGGALRQLTRDHTQVQEMLDRGLLDAAGARNHPMGHVLARAVGVQPQVVIDRVGDAARTGDIFLLCSDGLHGVLTDDEIAAIIGRLGLDSAQRLVEACLDRGAPDNVTVAIVHVGGPAVANSALQGTI